MTDDIEIKESGKAWGFVVKKKLNGEKEQPPEEPNDENSGEEFVSLNKGLHEKLIEEHDRRTREAHKRLMQRMEEYENRPEFKSRFRAVNSLVMPNTTIWQAGEIPGHWGHGRTEEVIMSYIDKSLCIDFADKRIEIPMAEVKKLLGTMQDVNGQLEQLKQLTNDDGKKIIQGTEDAISGSETHNKE